MPQTLGWVVTSVVLQMYFTLHYNELATFWGNRLKIKYIIRLPLQVVVGKALKKSSIELQGPGTEKLPDSFSVFLLDLS